MEHCTDKRCHRHHPYSVLPSDIVNKQTSNKTIDKSIYDGFQSLFFLVLFSFEREPNKVYVEDELCQVTINREDPTVSIQGPSGLNSTTLKTAPPS